MSFIKTIEQIVKKRQDNGKDKINVILISEENMNTVYLEFLEMITPETCVDWNLKSRVESVNCFMKDLGLPEIEIITKY